MSACLVGTGCTVQGRIRAGLCTKHYSRRRRTGDAYYEPPALTVEERFWSKVTKADGCWTWGGHFERHGYGRFGISSKHLVLAHRFAWELTNGPVPDGLELDHRCRNRGCCNPAHLEPVTHAENMRRAAEAWK